MNEIINLLIIFIHLQRLQSINKHNSINLKILFPNIFQQNIKPILISQHLIKQLLFLLSLTIASLLHIHNPHITLLALLNPIAYLKVDYEFVLVGLLDVVILGVFEQGGDGRGEQGSTRDVQKNRVLG